MNSSRVMYFPCLRIASSYIRCVISFIYLLTYEWTILIILSRHFRFFQTRLTTVRGTCVLFYDDWNFSNTFHLTLKSDYLRQVLYYFREHLNSEVVYTRHTKTKWRFEWDLSSQNFLFDTQINFVLSPYTKIVFINWILE